MQTNKEDVPMEQAGNGEAQDGQEAAVGGAEENIKSPYLTLDGIKGRQATIVFARMEKSKDSFKEP